MLWKCNGRCGCGSAVMRGGYCGMRQEVGGWRNVKMGSGEMVFVAYEKLGGGGGRLSFFFRRGGVY